MEYTKENDRYFYAGDVFNRDSTVCAYNCADSGTLTATASINSDVLKSLSGTTDGIFTLSTNGGDWSPVKLAYAGEIATDAYTTKDTIGTLSVNLDDVTSRIGALEKSFAELAQTMKNSVSSIDRSAFKTLKPKYEVL